MKVFEKGYFVVAISMNGHLIDFTKTFGPYSELEISRDVRDDIVNEFSYVFIIDLAHEKLV